MGLYDDEEVDRGVQEPNKKKRIGVEGKPKPVGVEAPVGLPPAVEKPPITSGFIGLGANQQGAGAPGAGAAALAPNGPPIPAAPAGADWRTISQAPPTDVGIYKTMEEALGSQAGKSAGQAMELPGSGWVAGGEGALDRGLASSQNPADQLKYLERTLGMPIGIAMRGMFGNGVGPNSGLANGMLNAAQTGAVNSGKGADDLMKGGLAEYGLKVRVPQEDLAKLAQTELAGQGQERVAQINKQALSQQNLNQAIMAAKAAGRDMTPQEIQQIIDMDKAVQGEYKGQSPVMAEPGFMDAFRKQQGLQGPVAPIGLGGAPSRVGITPPPKIADVVNKQQSKVDTSALINSTIGPAGPDRKFDAAKLAKALATSDPSMVQDDQLDRLATEIMRSNLGQKPKLLTDLAKQYIYHSRNSGNSAGVGDWGIQELGNKGLNLVNSNVGQIQGVELPRDQTGLERFMPGLSQSLSGTGPAIHALTPEAKKSSKAQAEALGRFLSRFVQQGE